MGELVRLDVDHGIATITLDSQHNRNALSRQLLGELSTSIDVARSRAARAIVLRHEGPAFCSGADLKERAAPSSEAAAGTASTESTASGDSASPMVDVLRALMEAPCPTIAAVEGAVRAGGIGLMASCDLVVVHRDVSFALTEVRIGVAPAIISVPILRRVTPTRIAAAMLTGEAFGAAAAREMGLVSHVSDDVSATVTELCDGILAGAPRAVAETKRLLHRVPTLDLPTAFTEMATLSDELFRGPDAAEGIAAFRERRQPTWAD